MNKIIIKEWYGRNGNNFIQLINACIFAEKEEYNIIEFPNHSLFIKNKIEISNTIYKKKNDYIDIINNNFYFYLINKPEIYYFSFIKHIFDKYIKLYLINFNNLNIIRDQLCIHIRGGDVFQSHIHFYAQPPLFFYDQILDENKHIINPRIISEDKLNPCVNQLINKYNCIYIKQNLNTDLEYLINAKILCFGYGTFSIIILLLNNNIDKLYLPDYVYYSFLNNWKIELKEYYNDKLIIINLPDSISKIY
jgi:hypothetical protein